MVCEAKASFAGPDLAAFGKARTLWPTMHVIRLLLRRLSAAFLCTRPTSAAGRTLTGDPSVFVRREPYSRQCRIVRLTSNHAQFCSTFHRKGRPEEVLESSLSLRKRSQHGCEDVLSGSPLLIQDTPLRLPYTSILRHLRFHLVRISKSAY